MPTDTSPPIEPETAGALLRQAREAAGLSLDAVAQQLKLAPRQVEALEDGDYSRLPGRTFVRGFMRNYARLMQLDPDSVLAALPGASSVPALGAPTLHATSSSIGELPNVGRGKAAWTRWLIPLVLIAIVATAAYFEYRRQAADSANGAPPHAAAPAKGGAETTTALPNPLASQAPAGGDSAPTATIAQPPTAEPSPAAAPAVVPAAGTPTAAAAPAAEEAKLVLSYRDFSWTEIRDATGRVLIAKMMRAGEEQSVSGAPPFDVVIGNSADVKLAYRGQAVDLAPLSRGNVARFTLK